MRLRRRRRSLAGTGVIFVSGGEPLEGCEAITLLVVAESPDEAESRAREAGVYDPSAWEDGAFRIRPEDINLALTDARGFAWKPGHERTWEGSHSWPGP